MVHVIPSRVFEDVPCGHRSASTLAVAVLDDMSSSGWCAWLLAEGAAPFFVATPALGLGLAAAAAAVAPPRSSFRSRDDCCWTRNARGSLLRGECNAVAVVSAPAGSGPLKTVSVRTTRTTIAFMVVAVLRGRENGMDLLIDV
jgi:hypothetical protein